MLRGAPPVGLTSKQAASVCASRVREGILFARLSFPVPGKSEMGLDGRTDGRSDLTRRCLWLVCACVLARSACLLPLMLGSLGGVCVYPGMPTCDIPLSTSVQAALILIFDLEREEGGG